METYRGQRATELENAIEKGLIHPLSLESQKLMADDAYMAAYYEWFENTAAFAPHSGRLSATLSIIESQPDTGHHEIILCCSLLHHSADIFSSMGSMGSMGSMVVVGRHPGRLRGQGSERDGLLEPYRYGRLVEVYETEVLLAAKDEYQ